MRQRPLFATILSLGLLAAPAAQAAAWEDELFELRSRWEHTTTALEASRREAALEALAEEAAALAEAHPETSRVLIWQGIVLASLAREAGGLDALGAAKEARRVLERAVELDPEGHRGSAYVTLGALYDRAPGWPVAFGDDETAERMFQRALAIRPDGIDVNTYYALYLEDEGRTDAALEHARRAVAGRAREGREASDEALRERARRLVVRLQP
ncbi:TRAP transporter TatT component family protein [Halomonas koreensis]|uniref:TRAP transporter TatT component family protein n=1 Tax=Halomonas koreensis TaxID=245385 RepID=A0ABU1G5H9_9GAMM|nr:TRAP transporter TatT component family protein [Halomonas koreensis]MDR5868176.1 TRAP transporter TatT component family protein [Halomonas koreensis]